MAVCGWRGVASVHATRSTVQGVHTRHAQELGLGARSIGRRPALAFVYDRYGDVRLRPTWTGAGDVARATRPTRFEFDLALFNCDLLQIFQQKWTKYIIEKL
jgi:hypothetical protein